MDGSAFSLLSKMNFETLGRDLAIGACMFVGGGFLLGILVTLVVTWLFN